jgi:hypothetical protein
MLSSGVLSPEQEFWYVLGLTAIIFALHTRFSIRRASRAASRPKNYWLLAHIAISVFELFRYQWRARSGRSVHANNTDLVVFLAQVTSSVRVLSSRNQAGYNDLTPFSLRVAGMVVRCCASSAGYLLDSPILHKAGIKINGDSFIYARLLIFIGQKTRLFPTHKSLYAAAAWLAGLISIHDFGIPFGPHIYILVTPSFLLLESVTKTWSMRRWVMPYKNQHSL